MDNEENPVVQQLLARIRELEAENAELREDNALFRRLSRRDELTDLLNRRGGLEEWHRACHEAVRRNEPLSIVFLDLIGFKGVNDAHGQPAGDRVLQAVGKALVASVRPADVVCRPGGDEFVVILPRTDASGTEVAIRRINVGLERLSVQLNGETLNGVRALYAHATEVLPCASSPLPMWDDVGTRIKAKKAAAAVP